MNIIINFSHFLLSFADIQRSIILISPLKIIPNSICIYQMAQSTGFTSSLSRFSFEIRGTKNLMAAFVNLVWSTLKKFSLTVFKSSDFCLEKREGDPWEGASQSLGHRSIIKTRRSYWQKLDKRIKSYEQKLGAWNLLPNYRLKCVKACTLAFVKVRHTLRGVQRQEKFSRRQSVSKWHRPESLNSVSRPRPTRISQWRWVAALRCTTILVPGVS